MVELDKIYNEDCLEGMKRNSRTSKIDVEIRFDDEQDATYMYNDSDLAKEE